MKTQIGCGSAIPQPTESGKTPAGSDLDVRKKPSRRYTAAAKAGAFCRGFLDFHPLVEVARCGLGYDIGEEQRLRYISVLARKGKPLDIHDILTKSRFRSADQDGSVALPEDLQINLARRFRSALPNNGEKFAVGLSFLLHIAACTALIATGTDWSDYSNYPTLEDMKFGAVLGTVFVMTVAGASVCNAVWQRKMVTWMATEILESGNMTSADARFLILKAVCGSGELSLLEKRLKEELMMYAEMDN